MRARFVTLAEGIEEVVRDDDRVAFEGFTHLIPFAAGHEAIRQRRKNLELVRMTPDILYDQMIGCGMARKLIFSWCGNPGVGSLHRVRDVLERAWPAPIEFEEYTHAAMAAAYDAAAANLPFAMLRGFRGSDLVRCNPNIRFITCPFTGEELGAIPAMRLDAAVIHAQQADEEGNVLIEGIIGVQKEAALSAKRVLVTVEERVETLRRTSPNACVLPSWTIDAIAVVPGGAFPSYAHGYYPRSNAFYVAWDRISRDREGFSTWIASNVMRKGPRILRELRQENRVSDVPYTAQEMMTVLASRLLTNDDVCFVGIGAPSAACNLARLTHAPGITLVYESGTIDTRPRTLPLSIGDGELCETALTTCSVPEMFRYWLQGERMTVGFLGTAQIDRHANLNTTCSVPEMFRYWLQGERMTVGFLGTAQIDRHANLNTTVVGPYERPSARLPGAGGASEAGTQCREIFIIVKQSPRSFVAQLDFLTTYGHGTGYDARQKLGITTKGPTQVISDLCHLQPDPTTKELKVVSLHPGVTRQQAIDATAWDLQFADHVSETPPPTTQELEVLRELKVRGEV